MTNSSEWNKRYASPEYVYGYEPNGYLKEELAKLKPGKLLLPGEGEGRNALWAAKQGWDVTAIDASEVAQQKAQKLFAQNDVSVQYVVSDILHYNSDQQFDAVGMVYVHLPKEIQQQIATKLISLLKPNGVIIAELFHPEQIALSSGGPKNPNLFASINEIKNQFKELEFITLQKQDIELNEGTHHNGRAKVIRMCAVKP